MSRGTKSKSDDRREPAVREPSEGMEKKFWRRQGAAGELIQNSIANFEKQKINFALVNENKKIIRLNFLVILL